MKALRQIINVQNNTFNVVLPAGFKAQKVEVIVLPVDEPKTSRKMKNSQRFSGAISEKTADKLHKHIKEVRNEWKNDIY
jgi:hypothetical protein